MKNLFFVCFLLFYRILFAATTTAEVLNETTSCTVKHAVLLISYDVAIRINSSKGDDFAKINIYYSNDNPISDFDAWIEDANGNKIRNIEKREIIDKNDINDNNLFDDNCSRSFELKSSTYPYVIKYKYTIKKKEFLWICGWSPVYNHKIPTLNSTLTLNVPKDYRIEKYERMVNKPTIDSSGKTMTYIWKEKYDKLIKTEMWSPPERELIPFVWVVPIEFKYGIEGNQKDWTSYGNWEYNLNKGLDNLPENEIKKVQTLTAGISDKKEIIKRLYQYMQDNTRYISVAIGIGGLKSYSAEDVCNKKYGDCKALSNYMKALLKAANIPAYCTEIYADASVNPYKIIPDFVAHQTNHVILMVPLDKDTVWLECTSKTTPAGYMGTFTQDRYALIYNESKSGLIKTPALTLANCFTLSRKTLTVDTANGVTVNVSDIYTGSKYELYSNLASQLSKDDMNKALYSDLPYENFELKGWDITDMQRDSAIIKLNYCLLLKDNLVKSGNYWSFSLEGLKLPQFEVPPKRTLPVRIAYPINFIDSSIITIPAGFTSPKPPPVKIESVFGRLSISYVINKNTIEVYRFFLLKPGEIATNDYTAFYKFISTCAGKANAQINLKKDE
jgi:hypothetical protein